MKRTVLIPGGAGFVGSYLAIRYKQDHTGERVVALDNLKRRGSEFNVPRLKSAGVEYIHGDIRNREDIEEVGPVEMIIDCSAEPSVLAGYQGSPEYLIHTNLLGTVNCLETARKYKSDVVFLSTSRVYPVRAIKNLKYDELETRFELNPDQGIDGVSPEGFSEDFPLNGSRTLYGTTKLASELLLQEYIDMYGIRGIINRCGVLTGPWQMGKVDQGFVVLWVARHIYHRSLAYLGFGGKGKQVRDILHVDDLYRLIAVQTGDMRKFNGHIYNVGGGSSLSVSLCELTALCQEITGRKMEIASVLEDRPGDICYYVSDCSKIREVSGWRPERTIRDIVTGIDEWIRKNEKMLEPVLS